MARAAVSKNGLCVNNARQMIDPIVKGEADVVLGSRLKGAGSAIAQGIPWWMYIPNRFLTGIENSCFGLRLSEHHTDSRAFIREALGAVNFRMNSDGFVFDQGIISQVVAAGFRMAEIAVPVRYLPEAFSAGGLFASCGYGLKILWAVTRHSLHASGLKGSRRLLSPRGRCSRWSPGS